MYERFFGLDELPFQLTPDPRYLFLSSKHREALGHLVYGIREGAGFVCITGEIGAGKTTLLRALLREADDTTKYAYILNPVLTGVELLEEINHELGASSAGTRRELLTELNRVLVEQRAQGRRVVLVVDEAQSLDGGILEQLRLLSNFETESAKLLQVVLVGQPELRQLLARPELEQLNQRITVRWHLGRMDRSETAQYVAHRVRTAGQTRSLFDKGAIAVIHDHSRGTPRLINVAAHRALMVAYAESSPQVTRAIARRAVDDLARHLPPSERPRASARQAALATAALAAAAALAVGGTWWWKRSPVGPGPRVEFAASGAVGFVPTNSEVPPTGAGGPEPFAAGARAPARKERAEEAGQRPEAGDPAIAGAAVREAAPVQEAPLDDGMAAAGRPVEAAGEGDRVALADGKAAAGREPSVAPATGASTASPEGPEISSGAGAGKNGPASFGAVAAEGNA
ncbi:MAG: AAA family ATPase, partial [Alphaproteobacteria bacterium]